LGTIRQSGGCNTQKLALGYYTRDYLQKTTDDKLYQIAKQCPNDYFPADLIGVKLDCHGS